MGGASSVSTGSFQGDVSGGFIPQRRDLTPGPWTSGGLSRGSSPESYEIYRTGADSRFTVGEEETPRRTPINRLPEGAGMGRFLNDASGLTSDEGDSLRGGIRQQPGREILGGINTSFHQQDSTQAVTESQGMVARDLNDSVELTESEIEDKEEAILKKLPPPPTPEAFEAGGDPDPSGP